MKKEEEVLLAKEGQGTSKTLPVQSASNVGTRTSNIASRISSIASKEQEIKTIPMQKDSAVMADVDSSSSSDEENQGDQSKKEKRGSNLPSIEELEAMTPAELEDLFNKNTASFRCLAQVLISRSSLLRTALYWFPDLLDPGLDAAFDYREPEKVFIDGLGIERYLYLCKEMNIVPMSRVKKGLSMEVLNLRYYGLSLKQMKAISEALIINTVVKVLDLQDNWLSKEMCTCISNVLRENNHIQVLNMKECRIGPQGAAELNEGINTTQSLKNLDLSYNDLTNLGLRKIAPGLRENTSIKKLNLGHNHLGEDSSRAMGKILTENIGIEDLDLSWNDYYTELAMKNICNGLMENDYIRVLNLSWNGLTNKDAIIHIMNFMKQSETLEEINLSNNRITDIPLRMIKAGAAGCPTLERLYLGSCGITPDETILLSEIFTANPETEMKLIDLEYTFVPKKFLPILKKLEKMNKIMNFEGILSNYRIRGPDAKKLLFERCKYLAMKPKKKKLKIDFGQFLFELGDKILSKQEFEAILKKNKMKLFLQDKDLLEAIIKRYSEKKSQNVDVVKLRGDFLERYPDTEPPPPKPKKKGKGKKGKKRKGKKGKGKSKSRVQIVLPNEMLGEISEEETPWSEVEEPLFGEWTPGGEETPAEGEETPTGERTPLTGEEISTVEGISDFEEISEGEEAQVDTSAKESAPSRLSKQQSVNKELVLETEEVQEDELIEE